MDTTRLKTLLYWTATAVIAAELAVGGVWDVLRTDYVRDVLETQLGFPSYVAVILGFWKIAGAVALLVPGFPRLKEWAYAGACFVYLTAAVSHAVDGDGLFALGPAGFAAITAASWALRPKGRRDPSAEGWLFTRFARGGKGARIAYWLTTGTILLVWGSGGIADITQVPETVAGMELLGYPVYFVVLLGIWKLLGAVALAVPRFPRLKEWAYAGTVFELTGAVISHAVSGSAAFHLFYTSAFALTAAASWALRPADRVLGFEAPENTWRLPALARAGA